jgi:hypothetical protein
VYIGEMEPKNVVNQFGLATLVVQDSLLVDEVQKAKDKRHAYSYGITLLDSEGHHIVASSLIFATSIVEVID